MTTQTDLKILVIGSGGREHTLAWKIAQSSQVATVFVAPGNAGTQSEPNIVNIALTRINDLIDFAQKECIALTVVGPEAPLAEGIVDAFSAANLLIFGPTKKAAQLESSKEFAKDFMVRHDIPTASYAVFTDASLAHAYLDNHTIPVVIKADGLAAGKGVVVAPTKEEAHAAIDDMLLSHHLGVAGARIVIEEFLTGSEASFIVMVDGNHVLPLATSQDHKRLKDQDQGPNTGGMGAISPSPIITPNIHQTVMESVILPTIQGMKKEGVPFTGFLYAGLMINEAGDIKVLEFNCRMGDPETQAILFRLQTDLVDLLQKAVTKNLDQAHAQWDPRCALSVVLAAHDYPLKPRQGDIIKGLPIQTGDIEAHVFHSGTQFDTQQNILTAGGRVLCLSVLADDFITAQKNAYALIPQIQFDGLQYRRDIGTSAIKYQLSKKV